MSPRWRRTRESGDDQRHREEAANRLAELRERADRVMPAIERRKRENHWTATVQSIIQGGAP